jgi:4a-hydroxytetrahydrobiopterin dehydratase
LASYLKAIDPRWQLTKDHRLEAEFTFPDFVTAMAFTQAVGALAEDHDHHPDITLSWGRVGIRLWTHTVGGVSPNDFILAAHIDALPGGGGASVA